MHTVRKYHLPTTNSPMLPYTVAIPCCCMLLLYAINGVVFPGSGLL